MQTLRDLHRQYAGEIHEHEEEQEEEEEDDDDSPKRSNHRASKRKRLNADDEDYNEDEDDQDEDEDLPSYKTRINWKARRCSKCKTKQTSCWRREISSNATLCNNCGLMSQENRRRQIKEDEEDNDDSSDTSTSSGASSRKQRRQSARSSLEIQSDGILCDHCGTTSSPVWRRKEDSEKRAYLCNACGIYFKNTQRMRPSYLLARTLRKSQKLTPTDNNDEQRLPTKKENLSTRHENHLKQSKAEEVITPEAPKNTANDEVILANHGSSSSQSLQTLSLLDLYQRQQEQAHRVENYASNLHLQQPLTSPDCDTFVSSFLSFTEIIDQADEFSLASNTLPSDLSWYCTYNRKPHFESSSECNRNDRTTTSDVFDSPPILDPFLYPDS